MSAANGRLAGVVAIVTGGSQGFGAEIVRQYSQEGAQVISIDLSCSEEGPISGLQNAVQMKGDVATAQTWQAAVDLAKKHFGKPPSVIVNNAGWTYSNKPTLDVTEEEFDRVFNVNVKSIYLCAKVLVPVMREARSGGSFIQISSTAAIRPRPQLTWCE